ncbi:MAG: hypothetical protein K2Q22_02150, partial [Cytophagales bacterium]|nr:hypothetical protein [Cytophagales bacterium]
MKTGKGHYGPFLLCLHQMKVLHIISNASGGAAKAALRLHFSLLKNGIDSSFLTFGDAGPSDIPNHYIFGKSPG